RCFAGTRASVGLRAKEKSNRRGGDAPAREMDCNASSRDRNIDLQFVRPAELYSAAPRNKTADKNVRWAHRQDAYVPVVERRRGKWIAILARPTQGHPERKRGTSPLLVDHAI